MSTAVAPHPAAAVRRGRVTQWHVVRSEWTKSWSLRSTRWSLLVAVAGMAGIGVLVTAVRLGRWDSLSPGERAGFNSIDAAVAGYRLAMLAVGVLGVLVISGEYSTGMIRSSFMAVPRRLPVLWAKLGVFCAVTFATMLASSLVAFVATQPIAAGHHVSHTLGDPGALRAVVGAALFLTVLGALSVGLGALVRNTAGGIALFVLLLFVLPGLTVLLPQSVYDAINPYLPLNAGTAVATVVFDPGPHLGPWSGLAVLAGYAAVAVAAAALGLVRRDA
jgi:ABC-type transport system involved in multi-copper enzyme maturation permease subunit